MIGHKWIQAGWLCLAVFFVSSHHFAAAVTHKLDVSDPVPEFSVTDSHGVEFHYAPADQKVLLIMFFSPEKGQSQKAIEDVEDVLRSLKRTSRKLSFLAVSEDPNSSWTLPLKSTDQISCYLIKDNEFKLWGRFGIIASPTVYLAGSDGIIDWVKAGYGYDFAPMLKANLQAAMGMIAEDAIPDAAYVKTVTNDSTREKANRHLKMAQMLEEKKRYDAALVQLETAHQIDPNSIACSLELGRVYCLASQPRKAMDMVQGLSITDRGQQSIQAYILGKACRQLKEYEQALKYLLKAVELDPKNSRAYYELGTIYSLQDQKDKALEAYRKALNLIYGD